MIFIFLLVLIGVFLIKRFFFSSKPAHSSSLAPLSISVGRFGVLQSLQPQDFGEAALCMAEAFSDSPWYNFIFSSQKERGVCKEKLKKRQSSFGLDAKKKKINTGSN